MKNIKNTLNLLSRSEFIYYYYGKIRSNIQPYVNSTFEASKILDNLWLGAIQSSCNRDELKAKNIETVVTAVYGASAAYPYDFNYERAKLRDVEDENILEYFETLLPKIHNELINNRGVLVHCIYGRSRSTSIVAAYLIKYKKMTTEEALKFIKEKRTQIDPNPSYLSQLKEFEKKILMENNTKKNK